MRDTIRPEGLKEKIGRVEAAIPLYIQGINSQKDPNLKKGGKGMLFTIHLQKTISHYSAGDDKETIKNSLLEMIPAFIDGWDYEVESDYVEAIWVVCLALLCDIDIEDFKKITDHIKREKINDALLSKIIQHKQPDWENSNLYPKFGNPYNRVLGLNNAADIKTYLDKHWYQEHEDDYWIDLHKSKKVNNYFGYWAWEVAAIAKIIGIDDSTLKTHKYYPYDAVHW